MATTDRIDSMMTQECRIDRSGITWDANLKQDVGTWGLVGIQRSVPCLIAPLRVTDDMFVVGALERNVQRLFLPLTVSGKATDIELDDQVTIANDEGDDVVWIVEDPPTTQSFRGAGNHIEVLVRRKAVQ